MSRSARAERGLSLIELLVAVGLGVTLSLALGSFMFQGTRSSREDINLSSMLDELGYATAVLTNDLEMAGFWAQVHDPTAVDLDAGLNIGTDCGPGNWYKDLDALAVLDNNTGQGDVAAQYPCLDEDAVVPGTDIVAIKRVLGRVAGTDTDTSAMQNGMIYLRVHDKFGRLYLHGTTPAAVDAPYQNWQYAPVVYYLQKFSTDASESPAVPSLCRMTLAVSGGVPTFARECVARGIENLQVEIGVDTDEDGSANYFASAPAPGDLSRAATARLYLQVRSVQPDFHYTNAKTYQIGNGADYTPAGDDAHYYRKTLSREVALRNPRGLQGVAVQ